MPFMDWNRDFALGVDALDLHRIAYIKILNEFYKTVMEDDAQLEAGPLLRKLKEEMQESHSVEEKLLERIQYPWLAEHRQQHRGFAERICNFELRHEQGDHAASIQVPRFLLEWLYQHMLREDQRYLSYLAALPIDMICLRRPGKKNALNELLPATELSKSRNIA